MRWRLFSCLALLSAVLFTAVLVLWVRSGYVADEVQVYQPDVVRFTDATRRQEEQATIIGTSRGALFVEQHASTNEYWGKAFSLAGPRRKSVEFHHLTEPPDDAGPGSFFVRRYGDETFRFAGFRYIKAGPVTTDFGGYWGLQQASAWIVPLWALAVLFAIPPALWWWLRSGHRRRVRIRRGLCPRCAYNLTGCTGAHCPECGEAVPASTSTS